ncbi:hypothetical protein MP619_04985 [Streptococcus dysgalactiae]|uniref:Uncharacterized protein n=1 Tax=Streptococcus dysgalactiae TaxID=1334 RepID=A0AAE9UNZ8_STRDY|nr:hypothetical protein [Streptococcus dysgalactiae]WAI93954.1 hypothetical protein MP619_04985 [Streptococcus dysgalactiae]WCE86454.1 hypothetical protein PMN45_02400 [Streptococcus dysgalactiae]WCN26448.1 hypothetical protein PP188_02405 [Streptococcus dysgalactiae]
MTIIDFQGTKQIFYEDNAISEVWYNNNLIWRKPLSERILLFSGQLTTSFTRLNVYDTYIFSADGVEVIKQADDIGIGYIDVGNHSIVAFFNGAALYVRLYGGAFDIDIYGQK